MADLRGMARGLFAPGAFARCLFALGAFALLLSGCQDSPDESGGGHSDHSEAHDDETLDLAAAVDAEGWTLVEGGDEDVPTLLIDPANYDFEARIDLLERILGSPHGYFRFINTPFARRVCHRFADDMSLIPSVNLHGDAHLEQYAISGDGRGLTDFDDATTGPATLDLIRFGVSLQLAAHANRWPPEVGEAAFEAFLRGYKAALLDHELEPPATPAIAKRLRAAAEAEPLDFLASAEEMMGPLELTPERTREIQDQFTEVMAPQHPELDPGFFDIKRSGTFGGGIGSALDSKFLLRIEGPTDADADDLILEAKEVSDLSGIPCVQPMVAGDAFRILIAQSRLAYQPYEYIGYILIHPRTGGDVVLSLWVHEWTSLYREVDVLQDLGSPADLQELAYDCGVQLGLGHPRQIADPLGSQFRAGCLASLEEFEAEVREFTRDMTEETLSAWQAFRALADPVEAGHDHVH